MNIFRNHLFSPYKFATVQFVFVQRHFFRRPNLSDIISRTNDGALLSQSHYTDSYKVHKTDTFPLHAETTASQQSLHFLQLPHDQALYLILLLLSLLFHPPSVRTCSQISFAQSVFFDNLLLSLDNITAFSPFN